jgi:uncharacterized protein YkwD
VARPRLTLCAALTTCLCICPAAPSAFGAASAVLHASADLAVPVAAAAASVRCPDAELAPHAENLDRVRAAVLCLINRERTRHGERALRFDARIEHAAQRHTEDMAFGDYFDHVGPHGDTPLDRLRAAGYVSNGRLGFEVGENIAWGTLSLSTPQAIVAAWMASPGHRANILDARFRDTAVGVSAHPPASLAHGQEGAIYTQDFGTIVTASATRRGGARARHQGSRYNLRPLTTKRRRKGHGSTRRQVRHRHRVGARHRTRHRRAVRRAGRAGTHQRPRR